MQPILEVEEESHNQNQQTTVDILMRLRELEKYLNPRYKEIISVNDGDKDIGIHISEALNNFPLCKRFQFNLAQNRTFKWDVRVTIPPLIHVTLHCVHTNGAVNLSTTVKMTEVGTKLRRFDIDGYRGIDYREPVRCMISERATLEIHGMILEQTGHNDNTTKITLDSSNSGIFSIIGDYGCVKFVQSRAKINENYFINAPHYHFGRAVFGHTWITNTGPRESFAATVFRGWNFKSSYMIVSTSHVHFENVKLEESKSIKVSGI